MIKTKKTSDFISSLLDFLVPPLIIVGCLLIVYVALSLGGVLK